MDEIAFQNLSVKKLKTLAPEIHEELLGFCSGLDEKEYPEATIILNGTGKNLTPLLAIYQRLG